MNDHNHRVNRQIRLPRIQLIDHNGKNHGVIDTKEAMQIAYNAGLDLVEVSPSARPPVCKVMNYGQYKYQQKKNNKSKPKQAKTKTIKFRPRIENHDLEVLIKRANKFLSKGSRVQTQINFHGRWRDKTDIGYELLNQFIEQLKSISKVESPIRKESNHGNVTMKMMLAPLGE